MNHTSSHSLIKTINILLFSLYIVVVNTPRLNSVSIEVVIFTLWLMTHLFMVRTIKVDWRMLIFVWLAYEILLRVIGFSSSAWGNYGVHVLYFFPLLVFCSYREIVDEKEKSHLLLFYVLCLTLNVASNIFVLIRYPRYNQLLNYVDSYQGINLRDLNIGNTMFSYVVMLFSIFAFYFVCSGRKKYWIPFFLSLAYILMSSKTTALLIMFVGFLYVFLKRFSKRIKTRQRIVLFFIGIGLLFCAYKYGIPLLASNIDNVSVQERLNAISSGDFGSEYFSRIELAKLSFDTFIKNPLIGVGYELVDSHLISLYSTGIGHHSEIIDMMGRYGMVGIIFNTLIYVSFAQFIQRLSGNKEDKTLAKILLVVILVYSFLNNSISAESGLFLFFLIPSIGNGDLNY